MAATIFGTLSPARFNAKCHYGRRNWRLPSYHRPGELFPQRPSIAFCFNDFSTINSPIPGDGTSSLFSVAFNSLYNYNSESNGSSLNGSCPNGSSSFVNSAVARSTSSHNLDPDQENKKRKDLEYKWVRVVFRVKILSRSFSLKILEFTWFFYFEKRIVESNQLKANHEKISWEVNKFCSTISILMNF